MKITIKDSFRENTEEEIIFTNDQIENPYLLDMIVAGREYTLYFSDLQAVVKAFETIKDNIP